MGGLIGSQSRYIFLPKYILPERAICFHFIFVDSNYCSVQIPRAPSPGPWTYRHFSSLACMSSPERNRNQYVNLLCIENARCELYLELAPSFADRHVCYRKSASLQPVCHESLVTQDVLELYTVTVCVLCVGDQVGHNGCLMRPGFLVWKIVQNLGC